MRSVKLQNDTREMKLFIAGMSQTIENQQNKIHSLVEEEQIYLKRDEENTNMIIELDHIIQDFETKFKDKNVTNLNLIRSTELKSETIINFHSANKQLQAAMSLSSLDKKKKESNQLESL
jgi:hypothetical protein